MAIQTIILWLIVGIAAWHVGRRLVRLARGLTAKPGAAPPCAEGCGACAPESTQPSLVTIALPPGLEQRRSS